MGIKEDEKSYKMQRSVVCNLFLELKATWRVLCEG